MVWCLSVQLSAGSFEGRHLLTRPHCATPYHALHQTNLALPHSSNRGHFFVQGVVRWVPLTHRRRGFEPVCLARRVVSSRLTTRVRRFCRFDEKSWIDTFDRKIPKGIFRLKALYYCYAFSNIGTSLDNTWWMSYYSILSYWNIPNKK